MSCCISAAFYGHIIFTRRLYKFTYKMVSFRGKNTVFEHAVKCSLLADSERVNENTGDAGIPGLEADAL